MNKIFEYWTKQPGPKTKPDDLVASLQPDWAIPEIAEKVHEDLPEAERHSFTIWMRERGTDEILEFKVTGEHVVRWTSERILPMPEPETEPTPEA